MKLMKRLNQHFQQLKKLKLPLDLSIMDAYWKIWRKKNEKDHDQNEKVEEKEKGKKKIYSSSMMTKKKKIEMNYYNQYYHYVTNRGYLDYLTSLTLEFSTNPCNTLYYLLWDKNRKAVSSTITDLTILGNNEQHRRYRNLDFYIYDWLDAFPGLQRLIINARNTIFIKSRNDENSNNNNDNGSNSSNSNFVVGRTPQQSQQYASSLSLVTSTMWQYNNNKTYPLKELHIQQSQLETKNGLSGLCHHCPHLKRLTLEFIEFNYSDSYFYDSIGDKEKNGKLKKKDNHHSFISIPATITTRKNNKMKKKIVNNNNKKDIIIDLSDLNLDYLYLSFITCTTSMDIMQLEYGHPIIGLSIQQLSTNDTIYYGHTMNDQLADIFYILHTTCRAVDIVTFYS